MSNNEDQRTCTNPECQGRFEELLQVNRMWKHDYGELLQQNQQLKAALGINNASRSQRSNSPVAYSEISGYPGPSPYSSISPQSSLGSMSLSSSSTVSGRLKSDSTRPSYNSSTNSSPIQYRRQHNPNTSPDQSFHPHSDRSTAFLRSNSGGQQNVLQRAEGYIQCAVADIENMKEQIRTLKGQYEKEKADKVKVIEKNKKLKGQLTENEDITCQLHQRIDSLEKKLKKVENERTNAWRGCNCEQQRKADLMGRGVFPRDEHGHTGYKEERDSITQQRQQPYQQKQREFEGGTLHNNHKKFRQMYPLIY